MIVRHAVRQKLQKQRLQLSTQQAKTASLSITEYIFNTSWFKNSQHIAFYWALSGEIDLTSLLDCAYTAGKTCYLPICQPALKSLCFVPHSPGAALIPNQYGILEPLLNESQVIVPEKLELVFTPLIAFDRQKTRLGSGLGYYDRTFAYLHKFPQKNPKLVGLGYAFQEVDNLSAYEWDVPLHKIVVFNHHSSQVSVI